MGEVVAGLLFLAFVVGAFLYPGDFRSYVRYLIKKALFITIGIPVLIVAPLVAIHHISKTNPSLGMLLLVLLGLVAVIVVIAVIVSGAMRFTRYSKSAEELLDRPERDVGFMLIYKKPPIMVVFKLY